VNLLAAILFNRNGQLGVLEETVLQSQPQLGFQLSKRQAARVDAPNQREGERAIGVDGILAAEILLIEYGNQQDVLRADDVIGGLRGRVRGPAAEAQHENGENQEPSSSANWYPTPPPMRSTKSIRSEGEGAR